MTTRPWASPYLIDKRCKLWRFEIEFSLRSASGYMGRFGGGWNWKLGFMAGGRTIIIHLLVADLRVDYKKD